MKAPFYVSYFETNLMLQFLTGERYQNESNYFRVHVKKSSFAVYLLPGAKNLRI